jgi:predicted O-methyltransferase YrrM
MPDFDAIRSHCDGMMKNEVYQAIYETALGAPAGDMVEIGTAHGAATICLALGRRDSGKEGRVYTFDRFAASGRTPYKIGADNLPLTLANLAKFKVTDLVEVVSGDISKTASHYRGENIALLMLDADGCIDRDLATFGDRVQDCAPVIVDDYADRCRVRRLDNGVTRVDAKHRITYHLVNMFERESVLKKRKVVYQTWFGEKDLCKVGNVRPHRIVSAYRELVHGNAELR